MDFTPNPIQAEWQARARAFAARVLAPRAAEIDAQHRFPLESFRDIRREGYLKLGVPVSHGGLWQDYLTYTLIVEAFAEACPATACCLAMHVGATFLILAAGSRVQKTRLLRRVVEDGYLLGIAFSDSAPHEDSPPGRVVARKVPGGYRLHGRKYFVTSAGAADLLLVQAEMVDGCNKGERIFAIPARSRDDVRIEEGYESLGLRGTASREVVFEGCWAPEEDILGRFLDPEPWRCQPTAGFTLGLSAVYLGIASTAYRYALDALRGRQSSPGQRLSQERQRLLTQLYTGVESARWMLYRAAWSADHDPDRMTLTLQAARYICSTQAVAVTQTALLAVGSRGYLTRNPLERLIRDALAGPLQAACHETCPDRIAQELLRPDSMEQQLA